MHSHTWSSLSGLFLSALTSQHTSAAIKSFALVLFNKIGKKKTLIHLKSCSKLIGTDKRLAAAKVADSGDCALVCRRCSDSDNKDDSNCSCSCYCFLIPLPFLVISVLLFCYFRHASSAMRSWPEANNWLIPVSVPCGPAGIYGGRG